MTRSASLGDIDGLRAPGILHHSLEANTDKVLTDFFSGLCAVVVAVQALLASTEWSFQWTILRSG
jgi:hypothetical protein